MCTVFVFTKCPNKKFIGGISVDRHTFQKQKKSKTQTITKHSFRDFFFWFSVMEDTCLFDFYSKFHMKVLILFRKKIPKLFLVKL